MLGPEGDEFTFLKGQLDVFRRQPELFFELYKYKPINDFLWKTLETSEMWFSHYTNLNDEAEYAYDLEKVTKRSLERLKNIIAPFIDFPPTLFPYDFENEPDARQIASYIGGRKKPFTPVESLFLFSLQSHPSFARHLEVISTDDSWLRTTIENALEILRWVRDTCLVHCFTDDPQNEIMWTDYAGGGTGVCIGYIAPKPTVNPITVYKADYGATISIPLQDLLEPQDSVFKMLTRKSSNCSYQREWRSFMGATDHGGRGIATPYIHPIREIIVGSRTAPEHIARVEKIAKHRKFAVRYATLKPRGGKNEILITTNNPRR